MSDVVVASKYARRLVEREAKSLGVEMKEAARAVASRLMVSTGSIWGLLYDPPKKVSSELFRRLRDRVERSLEFELKALSHELEILRQTGVDPRSDTFVEVETHLAAARRALGVKP